MTKIYNYYNIDLNLLLQDLTQQNDLNIIIEDLDQNMLIGFKILITKLLLSDATSINISTDYLNLIFGKRETKSIKKDFKTKTDPYNINSNTYNQFIIDMDSSSSKLFRLILHRITTGYAYSLVANKVSDYKINLPEHLELKLHKSPLTFKSFISNLDDTNTKPIVFKTLMEFDKQNLKSYFLEYFEFYNRPIDLLKREKCFKGKSVDKIISEQKDFFKARFEFNDYINNRSKYFKVNYTQADSGRYYTFLGSLNKNIRKPILEGSGYIEYDLELAAPSFLYQVYTQVNTTDNELKTIKYYMDNKQEFRNKVASIISGSEDFTPNDLSDAKQILTSLFFGSKSTKPKEYIEHLDYKNNSAIIKILQTPQKQKNFFENQFIERFTTEVKIMMKVLSKHLKDNFYNKDNNTLTVNNRTFEFNKKRKYNIKKDKKTIEHIRALEEKLNDDTLTRYYKNKIQNELNDLLYIKKWSSNSALAFFYQSWESSFLNKEIDIVKKVQKNGNKNMFLLHDAIYLKQEVDKNLFIDIEQTSNFKVQVKL